MPVLNESLSTLASVPSPQIEVNSKNEQEKFNVLKEVLLSEKKYLNDLTEIVEGYYEEIQKQHNNNQNLLYSIFSNITDIYEFTKTFYSLLKASSNDEIAIANCFIKKHKNFLKLYSIYCQNYKIAYVSTGQIENEFNLDKSIQKVRLKYGHCLKMGTYLQLPVLRITKYHLLLQRYLKLLGQEKETLAYTHINKALNLMKEVNTQINSEMPELDEQFEENTHQLTTNDMPHLISLFGDILKQGNLILVETKKIHFVIVFRRMLIIRQSASSTKILHSIPDKLLGLVSKSSMRRAKSFTIFDSSQSTSHPMRQFTFKANCLEEKLSWHNSIIECMTEFDAETAVKATSLTRLQLLSKKFSISTENNSIYASKLSVSASTNQINNSPNNSDTTTLRQKLTSLKRLADFRNSLKSDEKRVKECILVDKQSEVLNSTTSNPTDGIDPNQKENSTNFKSSENFCFDETIRFKEESPKSSNAQRRLSIPFMNNFNIRSNFETHLTPRILFQIDKNKINKKLKTCQAVTDIPSSTCGLLSKFRKTKEKAPPELETPRPNLNAFLEQLNSSFFEITDTLEENISTHNEKFQKSQINKSNEEGYFSNQDSSSVSSSNCSSQTPSILSNILIENFHLDLNRTFEKALNLDDHILNEPTENKQHRFAFKIKNIHAKFSSSSSKNVKYLMSQTKF
jgi:hypothetical protein